MKPMKALPYHVFAIFRALRDDRVVLTTGRGSGICFWPANRAIVVRFR